jgi:hypothetical protein
MMNTTGSECSHAGPREVLRMVHATDVTTRDLGALVCVLDALLGAPPAELAVALKLCAGGMRALRQRLRQAAGWRRRRWLPAVRSVDWGHTPPTTWRWLDHPYAESRPGEPRRWVSEPYSLTHTELRDLLAFADARGWEVRLDGRAAHAPGYGLRIILTPPFRNGRGGRSSPAA